MSSYTDLALSQVKAAKVQVLKNRDGDSMAEAMEIFVDPAYYVFGEVSEAVNSVFTFNDDNIGALFSTNNSDLLDIHNNANTFNISDLDLGI